MTIIYLFIWFIMYFIWKKEIRKMNEDLKEFIENKKEEE
jgi:hypothetical protein